MKSSDDDGWGLTPNWRAADNNLYGVLRGRLNASDVAEWFARTGWRTRASSSVAYEVETNWCQVDLVPVEGPDILLHGVIDPVWFDTLAALLSGFGLSFGLELYDDEGGLRREVER
ncbi:hypothetical protein ACIGW3_03335 [Streptomyces sp. NPDC053499]|uniref:hypothetical protein n=1 Tax=Streptomyces sp. NPDC053499 TaxID=3365707 RepID=UPI0037D0178C